MKTEAAAFLSSILENPEDDTIRLAYADFLEEQEDAPCSSCRGIPVPHPFLCSVCHGTGTDRQKRQYHAELIRGQILRTGLPELLCSRICPEVSIEVCAGSSVFAPDCSQSTALIRRGFVDTICADFPWVIKNYRKVARSHPIREVMLTDGGQLNWYTGNEFGAGRGTVVVLYPLRLPNGNVTNEPYYCQNATDRFWVRDGMERPTIELIIEAEFGMPRARILQTGPLASEDFSQWITAPADDESE